MRLPETRPLIYLITSGMATDDDFASARSSMISLVTAAVEMGVSLIQIREKMLSGQKLFELAKDVSKITQGTATRTLVNDRVDIAMASGADGVHLTTRSLPPKLIRENFGKEVLIGVSTHSNEEITSAIGNGADFAVFGPVFDSPGKGAPVGLEALDTICRNFDGFPIIALGGINENNFSEVLETRAAGFAAIRALNSTESMRRIVSRLK